MRLLRYTLLLFIPLVVFSSAAYAQNPGPEFWRRVSCEPFVPRTRLEALESKYGTVLIKGFTRIITVEIRGTRIDAVELRAEGGERVKGVVVSLSGNSETRNQERAYIDYSELDPLLNAIDALSAVNESSTKLANFEAKYRTNGDLQISVFRQTRSGSAVIFSTGICEQVTQPLSLDDLAKFRAMILEAKGRLDDIK